MDKKEAKRLLSEFLADLEKRPYQELVGLIGEPVCFEIQGSDGKAYQIEYEGLWDSKPGGLLRVIASIDDGGLWSAFAPLTMDLLVDTDGTLL